MYLHMNRPCSLYVYVVQALPHVSMQVMTFAVCMRGGGPGDEAGVQVHVHTCT